MPRNNRASGQGATAKAEGPTASDRLNYIADLLSELRIIAADEGCETLAGLLSLSQAEAVRQAEALRKPAR